MNKEFIPYDQALALKELGFDEPCFGYRKEDNVFDFFGTPDRDNTNSIFQVYPTAPTFSQCFRWFREKYKLYSIIFYHTDNQVDFINPHYFRIYKGKNKGKQIETSKEYKNYEEAELECLKKLIEIVNNA